MSTRIMSICWPIERVGDHKMTPTEKVVLISLADNANDQGGCWPSIKSMQVRACLSRRSVFNAIRRLESLGLVSTESRGTQGRSSFYTININRCISCTRAADAPVHDVHPSHATGARGGVQQVHPGGATDAPGTVREPSLEPSGEPSSHSSADADLLGDEPMPIAASRSSKPEPVSDQAIVDLYHEMLPQLPRVVKLTEKRKAWIEARRDDHPDHRSIEFWRRYFGIVQRSPHLLGNNDRGWTANFEWLVNSSNFVKTIEGQYLRPEGTSNESHCGSDGQGRSESLHTRLAKRGRQARAEREARESEEASHGY